MSFFNACLFSKLGMKKSFNIRFGRKYDSRGTTSKLFDVLEQIVMYCVMEDRDARSAKGRILMQ